MLVITSQMNVFVPASKGRRVAQFIRQTVPKPNNPHTTGGHLPATNVGFLSCSPSNNANASDAIIFYFKTLFYYNFEESITMINKEEKNYN